MTENKQKIKSEVLKEVENTKISKKKAKLYKKDIELIIRDSVKKAITLTQSKMQKIIEEEKAKWTEERGRMAKLLFEKGVRNW